MSLVFKLCILFFASTLQVGMTALEKKYKRFFMPGSCFEQDEKHYSRFSEISAGF